MTTLRWAPLLAAALAAFGATARAQDCAAIASGKVAFHGTAHAQNPADKDGVETTFSYQPGDIVRVTFKRAGGVEGGYEIVKTHQTASWLTKPKAYRFEYALVAIDGDPTLMTEGAKSKYRDVVTKDGAPVFEEIVDQTVGAPSVRRVGECSFAVVRVNRNGATAAAQSSRTSKYDYAPALGISLWSETMTVTKSGPTQLTYEITSVQDGP